jgi:hypothetical protein
VGDNASEGGVKVSADNFFTDKAIDVHNAPPASVIHIYNESGGIRGLFNEYFLYRFVAPLVYLSSNAIRGKVDSDQSKSDLKMGIT